MQLSPDWEYVADTVMGGVSTGQTERMTLAGRDATRLTGDVSLDNDGGFVQMAFDLNPDGGTVDASAYTGIEITIRGNDEAYDLRLRPISWNGPGSLSAPRSTQQTSGPPCAFPSLISSRRMAPDATLDPARLRRIGVLAIGREFHADVAVADIGFY